MANLIDVRRENGSLTFSGSDRFQIALDPENVGARKVHSLVAGWERTENGLRVFSDRLGFVPLFVYQDEARIVASDRLSDVVRAVPKVQLDTDALAVFFRLGYFLGDDTAFQNIRVVPPGVTISWTGNYSWPGEEKYSCPTHQDLDYQRAAATYLELFAAAVRRRSSGVEHIAVPLSGGRDSRHILLQLVDLETRPEQVITIRTAATDISEVETAAALARECGLSHQIVSMSWADIVRRELDKNKRTHCLSDEHDWCSILSENFAPGIDTIFDGIGGDVLSNQTYFNKALCDLMIHHKNEEAARLLLPNVHLSYLALDLQRQLGYDVALKRLEREIARHCDMPNPVKSFYFWNRTRREVALAPICIIGKKREICLPYVDDTVFQFLMGLPAEPFGPKGFHDYVIASKWENVSKRIPYAEKGDDPLAFKQQVALTQSVLAFLSTGNVMKYGNRRFILPRMAKMIWSGAAADLWWFKKIMYIKSLEDCSGRELL